MNNIIEPLRLAVGSHQAGSGKGCAMNVISWENGDATITDFPGCADPFLARVVQRVNDTICTHRDGDLLCSPCSLDVLALGHRTVGTTLDLPDAERARVYVEIAVEEAESVLRKGDEPSRRTCALVRRFLAGDVVTADELYAAAANAANAADANAANAAYAAAAYAADAAAANAAYAAAAYAADAAAANAAYAADAYAAAYAADAYAAADAAYAAGGDRLARAHRIIDRFEALTGVKAAPVPVEKTAEAVAAMMGAK